MPSSHIILADICLSLPSGELLFSHSTLTIQQRVSAIVGRNGIGKSTLGRIISGEIVPDSGTITLSGKLAYVPQSWQGSAQESVASILGLDVILAALRRIEQGGIAPEDHELVQPYWDWQYQIATLCDRMPMKFQPDLSRPIGSYSAGEQLNILLLAALWRQADILVLDEPGNYLDSFHRQALRRWILESSKVIVVISHDPELLGIVDEIWELTDAGIYHYSGNYEHYRVSRLARLQSQANAMEEARKQQRQHSQHVQKRMEKQQRRESGGRQKAKKRGLSKIEVGGAKERASSNLQREKQLDNSRGVRIQQDIQELREQQDIVKPIEFELSESTVPVEKVIMRLDELQWGYNRPLQPALSITIVGPQRIHLIGANGSGKSTLLKTLTNHIEPISGESRLFVKAAFLDANLSGFHQEASGLDEYLRLSEGLTEQVCRDRLAWLGLRGDSVNKPVCELSGGNRIRLALAVSLLGAQAPQLLLLDEPSNHLDEFARDALIQALANYRGAMIVASHDLSFVELLNCDRNIVVG